MVLAIGRTESTDDFPHAGRCKNCERPFTRARRWQEFCKDACRANYNKRSWAVSLVGREYASVREAAELASVSESTVRRWARAGRVRYESYFGRIVILRGDLERARANSRGGS